MIKNGVENAKKEKEKKERKRERCLKFVLYHGLCNVAIFSRQKWEKKRYFFHHEIMPRLSIYAIPIFTILSTFFCPTFDEIIFLKTFDNNSYYTFISMIENSLLVFVVFISERHSTSYQLRKMVVPRPREPLFIILFIAKFLFTTFTTASLHLIQF